MAQLVPPVPFSLLRVAITERNVSCVSPEFPAAPIRWKLEFGPFTSIRANSGQGMPFTRTSTPMRASMLATARQISSVLT